MKKLLLLSLTLISSLCFSQVEVYVLDVGAGLCTVSKLPNGEVIVYDCGSLESGKKGDKEIENRLPEILELNSDIDLLILSHTDKDHISSTKFLFDNYNIKKILWTSFSKEDYVVYKDDTKEYDTLVSKIEKEDCLEVNLFKNDSIIPPGLEELHGDVLIRYISGFNRPQESWNFHSKSKRSKALNAVSITMQLEYKEQRIFFGGDAVGYLNKKLCATDKYILDNISDTSMLKSNVMIVPHHGSANGSSPRLIKAIDPEYAIFPAGTKYSHPSQKTVKRFTDHNSSIITMGTNKDDKDKSKYRYKKNNKDKVGDDEIKITISEDSELICKYVDRL
jgi:competence protein ComEC